MKVENGKITVTDGMGNEFKMTVDYGDFGKINIYNEKMIEEQ